jgi:hypothetical protein
MFNGYAADEFLVATAGAMRHHTLPTEGATQ